MKVKELIAKLQAMDGEHFVLVNDHEWCYEVSPRLSNESVKAGVIQEKGEKNCVVLCVVK
jgi:hypothetical protein